MPGHSEDELVSELRAIDASILFLRRLVRITISVDTGTHDCWATSMNKDTVPPLGSAGAPMHTVTLRKDAEVRVHLVSTYLVQDILPEPKRAGICQSEITLAFPIEETGDIQRPSQFVYAFLPIRDFGFKVRRLFLPPTTGQSLACH